MLRATRRSILVGIGAASFLLLGAVLLGGLLPNGSARPNTAAATQTSTADQPVTLSPPPPSCGYCADNLVGKTASEIGQYAVQWSMYNDVSYVITGTPQVLLARGISRDEVPQLGLGCLSPSVAVEEAPYALVILNGYFVSRRYTREAAQFVPPFRYLEVIIDLWAGSPVMWNGSQNGAEFRTALNDPSLPTSTDRSPFGPCPPTEVVRFPDGSPVHYGNTIPGCSGPCPTETGVITLPTSTLGPLPSPNPTFTGP